MNSPIQITPGMDQATMANAINENFRQLESESNTKIYKDDNGVQRALLGFTPPDASGKIDFVLAITIDGKNVVEELSK